jgi:hypothetical protein
MLHWHEGQATTPNLFCFTSYITKTVSFTYLSLLLNICRPICPNSRADNIVEIINIIISDKQSINIFLTFLAPAKNVHPSPQVIVLANIVLLK